MYFLFLFLLQIFCPRRSEHSHFCRKAVLPLLSREGMDSPSLFGTIGENFLLLLVAWMYFSRFLWTDTSARLPLCTAPAVLRFWWLVTSGASSGSPPRLSLTILFSFELIGFPTTILSTASFESLSHQFFQTSPSPSWIWASYFLLMALWGSLWLHTNHFFRHIVSANHARGPSAQIQWFFDTFPFFHIFQRGWLPEYCVSSFS